MDKFEKEIMVVDRATLFADGYFQGFAPANKINYKKIINNHYHYKKRGWVETRPEFKQPIAYCIIMNTRSNKIFAYQRASQDDYTEKRLRGKWSWGIGGHIDRIDSNGNDPIVTSMLREIDEEVHIDSFDTPEILGYINDDESEVGQVHFGLLFLLKTESNKITPKDAEIAWGGFKPYSELLEIVQSPEKSVESWSEFSLEPLRYYFGY
ncbi:NUDIX domain-containing protein [candidate division KSB1 bacterium]|nr:NUDIX domain-containing protein [candidate division KSB1 bacterium]